MSDQVFWGQRAEELGVGLTVRKISVDSLTNAFLHVTSDASMKTKCQALTQSIQRVIHTSLYLLHWLQY